MGIKVDRSVIEGDSTRLFKAAIRSKQTLDSYERKLAGFLQWIQMDSDSFVNLAKQNPKEAENKIVEFIISEKGRIERREIVAGTLANSVKVVRLLLEMNDIVFNWKKIRRLIPSIKRYADDRIPSIDELRKTLEADDMRGRALTLTFISSGIREGAIPHLKVGNLEPAKENGLVGAARLVVYDGEPERYTTFVSVEAFLAIQKYLEHRRQCGEEITETSPLFRDKFDPEGKYYADRKDRLEKPKPMSEDAIRRHYNRLFWVLGFRVTPKKRHEFSVHSLRKYFKTKAELAGMKPIMVEWLLNHATGISDSYYRPTEQDLLRAYLGVADQLSVTEVEVAKKLLVAQEERHQIDMQAVMQKFAEIESRLGSAKGEVATAQSRVVASELKDSLRNVDR